MIEIHRKILVTFEFDRGGSPDQAVWALIGVNAFVFFLWQMSPGDFMARHFQVFYAPLISEYVQEIMFLLSLSSIAA